MYSASTEAKISTNEDNETDNNYKSNNSFSSCMCRGKEIEETQTLIVSQYYAHYLLLVRNVAP